MYTKRVNKYISLIYSVILIGILVILDQVTKIYAINNLKDKSDFTLIKNVFVLHYLENDGAAFSMLEGKMSLFLILTPILILLLLYLLIKMPKENKYIALDYIIVFLVAGAIGNYIDRIRFNYVVDFLYFSLINFPVFNVADCYVTCSVILLIILILIYYKDEDFEEIKQSLLLKKRK